MEVSYLLLGIQSFYLLTFMVFSNVFSRDASIVNSNAMIYALPCVMFFAATISYLLGDLSKLDLTISYLLVGTTFATVCYYNYLALNQRKEPTFGMFMLFLIRSVAWPVSLIRSLKRQLL